MHSNTAPLGLPIALQTAPQFGMHRVGRLRPCSGLVEGSFDEDYIQTLGEQQVAIVYLCTVSLTVWPPHRRQLHGEDNHCSTNDNYVLDMGFGRSAGIRQYASTSVQRRRCHLVHVRLVPQVDLELSQGVVPAGTWLQ